MSRYKIFDGSDSHLLLGNSDECAAFLRRYNEWRRGAEIEMPHPRELGLAIDMAIELIKQRDELLEALIAFRDGGPEGGNNFKEWHESYKPAIDLARTAIANAEGEK